MESEGTMFRVVVTTIGVIFAYIGLGFSFSKLTGNQQGWYITLFALCIFYLINVYYRNHGDD